MTPLLRIALAALGVAGLAPALLAQPAFTGLGTFPSPGGAGRIDISNLSADGRVAVGQIDFGSAPSHAFRWTAGTGVQSLGSAFGAANTYAAGVSADGSVIAGYTGGAGPNRAFRWTQAGGFSELSPLAGNQGAIATLISADGSTIVGGSYLPAVGNSIVRWVGSGPAEGLGLHPGHTQAHSWGMTGDARTVVGWGSGREGSEPIRWTEAGGMERLPIAPGYFNGSGFAVSADGATVLGASYIGTGQARAIRWTQTGGFEDLGILPGASEASAWQVSADGSVATGYCVIGSSNRAFLWRSDLGMVDLNEYLPLLGINLAGWELDDVRGLSADGLTIAGVGYHNGSIESWIAVIPAPASPVTVIVGFALYSRRRRAAGQC